MNWATGFRTSGEVDVLFLSGSTGRDAFEDAPRRTPEQERAGDGKVIGGIKRDNVEMLGASLKRIVRFRYYLTRREDVWDFRDEMYRFFEEFEPDLGEHPRPVRGRWFRGVTGSRLPNGALVSLSEQAWEMEDPWALRGLLVTLR